MNRIELSGCRKDVIMHHLKGLGVFKIIAEQGKDPKATAMWDGSTFVIDTSMTKEELVGFLSDEYAPMPAVSPWNKDSPFYQPESLRSILDSNDARFNAYKESIRESMDVIDDVYKGYKDAVLGSGQDAKKIIGECKKILGENKEYIISQLCNRLPEEALPWLDAVAVVTPSGMAGGPVLGSGGNDGRSEISKTFAGHVVEIVRGGSGKKDADNAALLRNSLFGESAELQKIGVVHFNPGAYSPTATNSTGNKTYSISNPWDFVLAVEGSVFFAGSVQRRGNRKFAAFPFTVNSTWAGHNTSCGKENDDRGEVWMPIWSRPATHDEVRYMYSEGRVRAGMTEPSTGVEFAMALANLGSIRGISAFQRFGIFKRKGDAHHIVSTGTLCIGNDDGGAYVLRELEEWLGRMRNKRLPRTAASDLRNVDDAIIRFCMNREPSRLQDVLIAVGKLEARISLIADKSYPPLGQLSLAWIKESMTDTPEFRLAASLASITDNRTYPVRANLEPIEIQRDGSVSWKSKSTASVGSGKDLQRIMTSILERRCMRVDADTDKTFVVPLRAKLYAPIKDVLDFIDYRVDDKRIRDLLLPLSCIKYDNNHRFWDDESAPHAIPEQYTSLKSNFPPIQPIRDGMRRVFESSLIRLIRTGETERATHIARRRLQMYGYPQMIDQPSSHAYRTDTMSQERLLASLFVPVQESVIVKKITRKKPMRE